MSIMFLCLCITGLKFCFNFCQWSIMLIKWSYVVIVSFQYKHNLFLCYVLKFVTLIMIKKLFWEIISSKIMNTNKNIKEHDKKWLSSMKGKIKLWNWNGCQSTCKLSPASQGGNASRQIRDQTLICGSVRLHLSLCVIVFTDLYNFLPSNWSIVLLPAFRSFLGWAHSGWVERQADRATSVSR